MIPHPWLFGRVLAGITPRLKDLRSMTSLGKQTRLNRIFRHPSGRILAVAVDHLVNYKDGLPEGLRRIEDTIHQIVEADPSSITLNKGAALRCMAKHAGRVPLIVQQMAFTLGQPGFADHASVEEVLALGADAIAVAIFVKGPGELEHIRHLGETVRIAERYGLPVIPHIYPIVQTAEGPSVSYTPDDVLYAARIGLELGADVVKVPYTGDPGTFGEIASLIPVPVVTAGGPQCRTVEDAEIMLREVAQSGAAGTTIGRNVWGFPAIGATIARLKRALFGPVPA